MEMKIASIVADLEDILKLDEMNAKDVTHLIVEILKRSRGVRTKEDYAKMLKDIRHRINKYLNFGRW